MRAPPFALAVLLAIIVPAQAGHCSTWSTTTPDFDIAAPVARYYVDHSPTCCADMGSYWIYEESNGINGLQREDEVHDDTCHGTIRPDTILF